MIRVLIERHIADDLAEHYEKAARKTLQIAMQAHGFTSVQSLQNSSYSNHPVVMEHFCTLQDCQRLHAPDEIKQTMQAITPLLDTKAKSTLRKT